MEAWLSSSLMWMTTDMAWTGGSWPDSVGERAGKKKNRKKLTVGADIMMLNRLKICIHVVSSHPSNQKHNTTSSFSQQNRDIGSSHHKKRRMSLNYYFM
jgi:hypothetical protein